MIFYQNYIKPDLFRKVITVIQYSSMFSGIDDVIKYHLTRGEHKTYFFRVLHSGIVRDLLSYTSYSLLVDQLYEENHSRCALFI